MKAGEFKARVLEKIISQNKKGNPQAEVKLDVDFGEGQVKEMIYYGQFTGRAAEFTCKALVFCGLQGNNPVGPITRNTEVNVVVEEEVLENGNKRYKVSWINSPLKLSTPMNEATAKHELSRFEGHIFNFKKEFNAQMKDAIPNHAAPPTSTSPAPSSDEGYYGEPLPF